MRQIFSIFFSIAIFINSVVYTLLMAVGLLFVGWTSKKKDFLHFVAGTWARNCVRLIFSRPRIKGLENLIPGENYIVVANHASNFDIFMLLGFLDLKSVFISKRRNFSIPVVGLAMRMMGCIPIKRESNRASWESMKQAGKAYQNGDSIIVFPEGTRSIDGLPKPFKHGFLFIAKDHPVRLLPVSISGTHFIQPKESWHVIPARIQMVIEKPLTVTPEEVKDHAGRNEIISRLEEIINSNFVAKVPKN